MATDRRAGRRTYRCGQLVLAVLLALAGPAGAFPVGGFTRTGDMTFARYTHGATLLAGGRVLIVGGTAGLVAPTVAELYDPATDTFAATGSLREPRAVGTATRLPDGRVLVAGGAGLFGFVGAAELYDPATGGFSPTGSLTTARTLHAAAPLPGGRVLVVAGQAASDLASAESGAPSRRGRSPTCSATSRATAREELTRRP